MIVAGFLSRKSRITFFSLTRSFGVGYFCLIASSGGPILDAPFDDVSVGVLWQPMQLPLRSSVKSTRPLREPGWANTHDVKASAPTLHKMAHAPDMRLTSRGFTMPGSLTMVCRRCVTMTVSLRCATTRPVSVSVTTPARATEKKGADPADRRDHRHGRAFHFSLRA